MPPSIPPWRKRNCGARPRRTWSTGCSADGRRTWWWKAGSGAIQTKRVITRQETGMASVQIRGIQKAFGSTHVIRGVDSEIEDGQFAVLVGPSGCGKSTLLRMLAGLEEITDGEIAIDGRVVNNVQPKERDIAMVFQNYALYPHMTVRDNMAFSLMRAKVGRQEITERVARAADILGLRDLLDRYPRQLSGG